LLFLYARQDTGIAPCKQGENIAITKIAPMRGTHGLKIKNPLLQMIDKHINPLFTYAYYYRALIE
jgi:hypothetical protein